MLIFNQKKDFDHTGIEKSSTGKTTGKEKFRTLQITVPEELICRLQKQSMHESAVWKSITIQKYEKVAHTFMVRGRKITTLEQNISSRLK